MRRTEVTGLADLERALDELPKAVGKGVLRRIGLRALEPFVKLAADLAPIDADPESTPKRPPGTLKRSYHTGTRLTQRQARMARKEGKSYVEVYAGTSDPGGVQTEFGNVRIAAQPHARPAWDATQDDALRIAAADVWPEVAKAAARVAKRRAKKGG